MSFVPNLSDPDFRAANATTLSQLRDRYPESTEEDLMRALRAAKWWLKEDDHLSEAELAIQLLGALVKTTATGRESIQLW